MGGQPKPVTRRTGRVSATERFHAAAGRGGSPVKVLVGAIGAVFLLAVAFILLRPRDDEGIVAYHIEQALQRARAAESEGRLDDAMAAYVEALGHIGGDEKRKTHAIEVRGWIRELKARRDDLARAEAEWKRLKAQCDTCTDAQARERLADARAMRERHRAMPWVAALDGEILKLEKREKVGDVPDPLKKRAEIVAKRNLEDRKGAADWSGAVRDWKDYLSLKLPAEYRPKAEDELARLQPLAREDFDLVRKRADRMVEEGRTKETLDLLKSQRKRFELTGSAEALERQIARHDR